MKYDQKNIPQDPVYYDYDKCTVKIIVMIAASYCYMTFAHMVNRIAKHIPQKNHRCIRYYRMKIERKYRMTHQRAKKALVPPHPGQYKPTKRLSKHSAALLKRTGCICRKTAAAARMPVIIHPMK